MSALRTPLPVVLLAAALVPGQAGSPQSRREAMSLGRDLVPFISDATASLVLATVTSAAWAPAPDEPGYEDGVVHLRVLERFSASGPDAGANGTIKGRRYGDPLKRRSMGFDGWNVVPLDPGSRLVFAIRVPASSDWVALAAEAVASNDTIVSDLHRAFELERISDPMLLPRQYEQALGSGHDLLLRYGLDAITRRGRLPRGQAAEAMVRALTATSLTANMKLNIVQEATKRPIYEDQYGADRTNGLVIGAAASLLVAEPNPEWALIWAQTLTAALVPTFSPDPNKDREIRAGLIRAVPEPARHGVVAALTAVAGAHPDDLRFRQLAERWSATIR
jgi:hypothetical protein